MKIKWQKAADNGTDQGMALDHMLQFRLWEFQTTTRLTWLWSDYNLQPREPSTWLETVHQCAPRTHHPGNKKKDSSWNETNNVITDKYERTIDQELTDAAAQAPGRRRVCTHQAAALICVVMAAILNYDVRLTLTIDVYLVEEQSCQISSRSDLKWQSLRLFEEVVPTRIRRWVAIWDQFLI